MIQERLKNWGLGFAEIIGIVTSFLFITGVCYFYGYYEAGLNAGWIINLLTTKELLISNLRLGAGVILVFMFLESMFDAKPVSLIIVYESTSSNKNKKKKDVTSKSFIFGILFLICLLIYAFFREKNWSEVLAYLLLLISVYSLIFYKPIFKMISILLIFFVIPFLNGVSAYYSKVKSEIPEVRLKGDSKKWLLFDTFSNQAILIDSLKKEKNIRVVSITDIENIKVK